VRIVRVVVERVVMVNHSFTIVGNEDDNRKVVMVIKIAIVAMSKMKKRNVRHARLKITVNLVFTIVVNANVNAKQNVNAIINNCMEIVKVVDKVLVTNIRAIHAKHVITDESVFTIVERIVEKVAVKVATVYHSYMTAENVDARKREGTVAVMAVDTGVGTMADVVAGMTEMMIIISLVGILMKTTN